MRWNELSGMRRLAIFASVAWLVLVYVDREGEISYWRPFEEKASDLLIGGGIPLAAVWGIWWVVQGFRRNKPPRT